MRKDTESKDEVERIVREWERRVLTRVTEVWADVCCRPFDGPRIDVYPDICSVFTDRTQFPDQMYGDATRPTTPVQDALRRCQRFAGMLLEASLESVEEGAP